MVRRKPLAEVKIGDTVIKVYDKEVLDAVLKRKAEMEAGKVGVAKGDEVINLNEFCKGLTMKECLEKIKREVKDYRSKIYSISFEV